MNRGPGWSAYACWRHQMETISALLALCGGNPPVTGGFPSKRPVTRSFDVFFDLRLNQWLRKQVCGWWSEMPSCSLWRHCNESDRYQNITKHSKITSWWRHQMETFSALLALCGWNPPVTGGFHPQRPVTRGFYVFFGLRLNKRLSKQLRRWWFETPSRYLWRHCNDCKPRRDSPDSKEDRYRLDFNPTRQRWNRCLIDVDLKVFATWRLCTHTNNHKLERLRGA